MTTVNVEADLRVLAHTDTPDPVDSAPTGQNITYTLTVTNNGPQAAQNVIVTDMVPANTTFAGFVNISQGSALFDSATGVITASFGTVTVGTPATVAFEVTASA